MPDMGDFDFSNFDPNSMPGGFTPGGNSGDSGSDSGSGAGGGMPSFGGSGMPGGTMNMSKIANIASLAGCLVLVLVSLLVLKFIRPKG